MVYLYVIGDNEDTSAPDQPPKAQSLLNLLSGHANQITSPSSGEFKNLVLAFFH